MRLGVSLMTCHAQSRHRGLWPSEELGDMLVWGRRCCARVFCTTTLFSYPFKALVMIVRLSTWEWKKSLRLQVKTLRHLPNGSLEGRRRINMSCWLISFCHL